MEDENPVSTLKSSHKLTPKELTILIDKRKKLITIIIKLIC